MTTMRGLWTASQKTHEVKVWQWIGVVVTTAVLTVGGVYGAKTYADDQRAESAVDAERSQYDAARASYENARDELTRCEQRVEGRNDLRNAFTDVYDYLERRGQSKTIGELRRRLDLLFPLLGVESCPDPTTPPIPPHTD
jgi:hypothetical protein